MLYLIIIIILLLGIAGILLKDRLLRNIVWLISLIPLAIGFFALFQGGIAEPFSAKFMTIYCLVAFWPVAGCISGEILILKEKSKINSSSESQR